MSNFLTPLNAVVRVFCFHVVNKVSFKLAFLNNDPSFFWLKAGVSGSNLKMMF